MCHNGIFLKEVKRLKAENVEGELPCFGQYSLISGRPKQITIKVVSPDCHFMSLHKLGLGDAI